MAIVTQNPDEIKTSETVSSFMRRFSIAKLLARCGAYKEKGISIFEVFLAIFQNAFSERNERHCHGEEDREDPLPVRR